MRNVFDQYTQNENRLTHALASVLHADESLRAGFVQRFMPDSNAPRPRRIQVSEQSYPGDRPLLEQEAESRGVPDMWLYDESSGWCAVVESKIGSALDGGQVGRHIAVARRRGFDPVIPVTITVSTPRSRLPHGTVKLRWRDIYTWLASAARPGNWAALAMRYFEVLEVQMADNEQLLDGTLTTFTGFGFKDANDYSYAEAKRVLVLAVEELRNDSELVSAISMDPALPGRKSITGRAEDGVWSYLQTSHARGSQRHTTNLHLTLGIHRRVVDASVTIPNGLERSARRRLTEGGPDAFQEMLREILLNMSKVIRVEPFAVPILRVQQRRYPTRKSKPFLDALQEIDLRTGIDVRVTKHGKPKRQPEWMEAAFRAFSSRRSNLEMQVGMVFPFERCPLMGTRRALEMISQSWCACRPLFERAYPAWYRGI